MPQPTISDVHIDRWLSNLSVGFLQEPGDFVAGQAFPMVPVEAKTNKYLKYNRSDFFRDDMKERAPGAPVTSGGYKQASGDYACKVWATKKIVDDQTVGNMDAPQNADRDATYWLTQKALINREVQWASKYFVTSVWGYEMAGQATADSTHIKYWDTSGSDPVANVLAARKAMKKATGYWPNLGIMGADVEEKLATNASIIDRIKYGQTGPGVAVVDNSALQALFKLPRILTMSGIQTTSAEDLVGDDDTVPATFDFIGGKHFLLAYAAPSPGPFSPSAGYTFNWTGYNNASGAGMKIKKYRWEIDAAYHMEVEQNYDFGLVSKYLGAMLLNAVQ